MQKGSILGLLLYITALGLQAQPQTVLSANNVNAAVAANGTLFSGGLEVPKNSNKKSIAIAQFWIGAKNNGNLHLAAQLNDSTKQHDFWAGPLKTTTANAADSSTWNTIYKVTRKEIEQHQTDYNKQGYTIPNGIQFWRGSSPQGQGFAEILAPFVDFNANKIYEPELGEYPYIRGDEAAYFIANDNANNHYSSGGLPLGVEVHGMVYQYTSPPELENTVFLQLSFINRTTNNYDSVFVGMWTDFILGNPNDNYISTNPAKNAYLVYNGDTIDETPNGYGSNPPAQAVVFLSQNLQYSIEIANDNSVRGLPQNPEQFYNYLKRTWKDDSQLIDAFNGYQSGSPTDFIYEGDPCSLNGWTEIGAALPAGKRTMMGSVGPATLNAGGFLRVDIAFVWARATNGLLSSVCRLNNEIDNVINFYKNEITGINTAPKPQFTLYPNPCANTLTVSLFNTDDAPNTIEIFDLQGQKVAATSTLSNKTEINTSSLATGIYTVKLSTANAFAVQKLLITR